MTKEGKEGKGTSKSVTTTDKKSKGVQLPVIIGAGDSNFDQLFDTDGKELDKQIDRHQKRKGKGVQLLAKINQTQMQIAKKEVDYRKSLVDPTMDSVDIYFDIDVLKKELEVAGMIYKQLFPEEASKMAGMFEKN